ncbi:hypothetical protein [Vallitalea okinawensis]|uniref:hypothetical protein n=1 Tax=Vallitalea okinawensis TaxID=2078660 RepID=UPI000CFB9DB9|nr:hypothetical protein [Vallitalea okinawensis]
MANKFKKAVHVLLFDLTDTGDLETDDSEEYFIDYIIQALLERNENTCPYKNYDAKRYCPNSKNCGKDRWDIDCNQEKVKVWTDFIN